MKENHLYTGKISNKKIFYIETYGCQMNVADSELIKNIMNDEGYLLSNDITKADAIFVNTCAIRDHAEEKVHSQLGRFALLKKEKPETIIGVLGCMAQNLKHNLLEDRPFVDIVLGPDSYRRIPELLKRKNAQKNSIVDTRLSRYEVYDGLFPHRDNKGVNAWISIMRGCDKFCTFCIVPFTRGRERSRSKDSILDEVQNAVDAGYSEVTLLGQNVNSYLYNELNFEKLLQSIAKIPSLKRIRYTSPHPSDITDELLITMSKYQNICNYIHLPLQSGSDKILKRMNRTYNKNQFLELTKKIRRILPNVGISTDIIVGFPGETNRDFYETIDVMNQVMFDSAFNFKYSSRPGTKASEYEDQIDEHEKQNRLEKIINLQKQHTLQRNQSLVGKVESVLVEKESKLSNKQWAGRTDSNKWVIFDKQSAKINEIVSVLITKARGITLHGELVKKVKAA